MLPNFGALAQLARAFAWHARGHRFDSDMLHNFFHTFGKMKKYISYLALAGIIGAMAFFSSCAKENYTPNPIYGTPAKSNGGITPSTPYGNTLNPDTIKKN